MVWIPDPELQSCSFTDLPLRALEAEPPSWLSPTTSTPHCPSLRTTKQSTLLTHPGLCYVCVIKSHGGTKETTGTRNTFLKSWCHKPEGRASSLSFIVCFLQKEKHGIHHRTLGLVSNVPNSRVLCGQDGENDDHFCFEILPHQSWMLISEGHIASAWQQSQDRIRKEPHFTEAADPTTESHAFSKSGAASVS